jgi:hypothetical protein
VRRLLAALVPPGALVLAFALWSFQPSRGTVPGWGGDSVFCLWTFELVWHRLATLGPLRVLSAAFWQAPLFGGAPLGLAYSENQLYAALLLWPLRALSGNGALTLSIGAVALELLAFGCAAGWLASLGFSRLAGWGGLVFAACGFVQSQYAHYQNLCIFVLPLALWSFGALVRRPSLWRCVLCGLAFGWIGGWNLYFQLFADLCLAALAGRALLRRELPRGLVLLLCGMALLVQWPIAEKYATLGAPLGGFRTLETYGASWRSLLGSAHRARALVPSLEVPIEAAGYLGVAWLALLVASARRQAARPWLLACALAFWLSLGRGTGLFDATALLPGFSGLRAIGRAQVLVMLFSLPAAIGTLEALHPRMAALALGAVLLELLPATRCEAVQIDPALWGPSAPLSRVLAEQGDPILVLPDADVGFMLAATQGWTPYFGGHSGRAPPGEELLAALSVRRPWGSGSLDSVLDLTRAQRVLALAPELLPELRASPRLRERGCFALPGGRTPCLFEAAPDHVFATLELDRDAAWEVSTQGTWPVAELRALSPGALDIRAVDRCRLRTTLRFPFLPALAHDSPLQGSALLGVRFSPGEPILRLELRQTIFHLPRALRPRPTLAVICAGESPASAPPAVGRARTGN